MQKKEKEHPPDAICNQNCIQQFFLVYADIEALSDGQEEEGSGAGVVQGRQSLTDAWSQSASLYVPLLSMGTQRYSSRHMFDSSELGVIMPYLR